MFTGLIDHCGKVVALKHSEKAAQLWISSQFADLTLGESIAIDGVCLTVTALDANNFCCDISPETLKLTRLGNLGVNQLVNLERSLRAMDRIGGHFVTGHVDQIGQLAFKRQYEEFVEMKFSNIVPNNHQYLIKKGSIAVNGVSLTINEIFTDGFNVMLIPHTLEITNLAQLQIGDAVNFEFDMLVKIVAHQVSQREYA